MVAIVYFQALNLNPIKSYRKLYENTLHRLQFLMKSGVMSVKTLHKIIGVKRQKLFKNCWNTPIIESTTIVKPSSRRSRGI